MKHDDVMFGSSVCLFFVVTFSIGIAALRCSTYDSWSRNASLSCQKALETSSDSIALSICGEIAKRPPLGLLGVKVE